MSKRAFLVCGPESSGTRLLTQVMVRAGCKGSDKHEQPWDKEWPTDQELIVWRRSVPHGGRLPDLMGMVNRLRGKGYMVQALVTSRDPFAMAHSAVKAGHVNNLEEAYELQTAAYAHIYQALGHVRCPSICVPYEALILHPLDLQKQLSGYFLLPKSPRVKVTDENFKYYEGA